MGNYSDRLNEKLAQYGIAPWTEEEMSGEWECDGCHMRGTFDELGEHNDAACRYANGTLKSPEDVACWGAMKVGSVAWHDYWDRGVHPMRTVLDAVEKDLERDA
jgi:hypothetical protein